MSGLIDSAVVPIISTMGGIVVVGVMLVSVGFGVAGARGVLTLIFRLMTGPRLPLVIYWRPVVFFVTLFWFWYLLPTIAADVTESRILAQVMEILTP